MVIIYIKVKSVWCVVTLITNFFDLIEHTWSAIQTYEKRKNRRSEREQKGFELAVKHILELLW